VILFSIRFPHSFMITPTVTPFANKENKRTKIKDKGWSYDTQQLNKSKYEGEVLKICGLKANIFKQQQQQNLIIHMNSIYLYVQPRWNR
jgi:hypothetical protein